MNKTLDNLHKKILKSKFAEEVTEAEIMALIRAKEGNNGWIPCSERLPEDIIPNCSKYGCRVLYCAESGNVDVSFYWDGKFETAEHYGYKVIAWQPLPESFKPEEE